MPNKTYLDAFDTENKSETTCLSCGLCLQKCPVMKMDKDESINEISRLLNGEATERVLNECTFCFRCNHYCPHDLKPYALIMERLSERVSKREDGIPPPVRYFFCGDGDSCIMWDVYDKISSYEKDILDKWETPPPKSEEVLFVGWIEQESIREKN